MPNLESSVAHDIVSPVGTLKLNQVEAVTNRCWLIRPDGYKIVPSLRVTSDNISQADGSVLRPRFKSGLVATMTVTYLIFAGGGSTDYEPACGKDLREMNDILVHHLDALRSLRGTQRLLWTPTDYAGDRRLLDQIQTLAWSDPTFRDGEYDVTFAVETEFPYAIDLAQTTTTIPPGTATITNGGTSDFKPVVKAHGDAFTITNNSVLDPDGNPLKVVYDSTRPGAVGVGGGYAEIDFFRGTIYLNGSGAELVAGLDPGMSDFFPLRAGANSLTVSGATVDVLWNDAWA